jgi:perosamine synthetase
MLEAFEARWADWNGLSSLGLSSWAGGALAALEFAGVRGETVLCPSNTFMATPLAAVNAGAAVEFVDCNRTDLCMSFEDFERKADRHKPKAAILVHIGGHIAFDAERIAAYCREHGIFLLEDCAHAHGAEWNGAKPGGFGDAGVYSLYATKTVSTGEGGVLVSRDEELVEFARKFRNYGKFEHEVDGLNFRMSEFAAALGLVQAERMEEIVAWKNTAAREHLDLLHPGRLQLPDGMISGLYKYIVFDPIEKSSGKVYDQPCHRIMGTGDELPNTDWVAEGHWCVPLYYRPEVDPA